MLFAEEVFSDTVVFTKDYSNSIIWFKFHLKVRKDTVYWDNFSRVCDWHYFLYFSGVKRIWVIRMDVPKGYVYREKLFYPAHLVGQHLQLRSLRLQRKANEHFTILICITFPVKGFSFLLFVVSYDYFVIRKGSQQNITISGILPNGPQIRFFQSRNWPVLTCGILILIF